MLEFFEKLFKFKRKRKVRIPFMPPPPKVSEEEIRKLEEKLRKKEEEG